MSRERVYTIGTGEKLMSAYLQEWNGKEWVNVRPLRIDESGATVLSEPATPVEHTVLPAGVANRMAHGAKVIGGIVAHILEAGFDVYAHQASTRLALLISESSGGKQMLSLNWLLDWHDLGTMPMSLLLEQCEQKLQELRRAIQERNGTVKENR